MFRFNPEAHDAWPEAIRRHQRQGDGEPLALMIRSGQPMPPEACDYLAALAVTTAKRPRGGQASLDPAIVYRDRRLQVAVLKNKVKRVAIRGRQQRDLEPHSPTKSYRDKSLQQRARSDEMVVLQEVGQKNAIGAAISEIEKRVGENETRIRENADELKDANPKSEKHASLMREREGLLKEQARLPGDRLKDTAIGDLVRRIAPDPEAEAE